jgi:glycosyltransferase involved in cell wall biosynthesis
VEGVFIMNNVDILIPTYNRASSLAVSLCGLAFQDFKNFNIFISNQGEPSAIKNNYSLKFVIRLLEFKKIKVSVFNNLPVRGMAQQRHFLLSKSKADYCLFIDDDIFLEPFAIKILLDTIKTEKCGFVGMPVMGLSYLKDYRPDQESIEFWESKVRPETILPGSPSWERYKLHSAANALHVQQKLHLTPNNPKKYKVAWVGGCTLFDREKLENCGGFNFWKNLPKTHVGEDVYVQLGVLKKYGGCGVIPTGAYHQELPTTLTKREIDVPKYLKIN